MEDVEILQGFFAKLLSKTHGLLLLEKLRQNRCGMLFIVAILKRQTCLSRLLLTQAADIGFLWKPASISETKFFNA